MISIIAAIGQDFEIGYCNKLLCHIPEDMAHFKQYTDGKCVLMGRKTWDSIGRKLPNRYCAVVTSTASNLKVQPDSYHTSLESALVDLRNNHSEIVVIGGSQIYNATINLADKLVITHIDSKFLADSFFPKIDKNIWESSCIKTVPSNSKYKISIVEYRKK